MDPVPHRRADDSVERGVRGRDLLCTPGDDVGLGSSFEEDGAHAAIRFDGPHVGIPADEAARQTPGAGPELEHIERLGWQSPPHRLLGRSGPKTVIDIGDRPERLAQLVVSVTHG
jgi:hypothetical protein